MNLKNKASKRALLVGASVVVALATSNSVQAACDTANNGTVTCTGEIQPFTVTSDGQVTIAQGATVTGSGVTAVRLNSTGAKLRVDGTISATGAAGLTIQNGNRVLVYDPYAGASPLSPYVYPYYYPAGMATIVVGEQGKISGDTGIWIERSSSNYLGNASASIDNSGLITATSGSAILGPANSIVSYSVIANRANGTINGIAANVASIDNAGLIDGRDAAAVTIFRGDEGYFVSPPSIITNSGTITSAGQATITTQFRGLTLINSGTIANSASGLAIDASMGLLVLTNMGTINGNIIAGASSSIDSSKGVINGNVTLGGGDDIVYAGINNAGQMTTGINGVLDGGGGVNSILFLVESDAKLTGTPVLPTNFSRLRATLVNDAKLTLDAAFIGTSTLNVSGSGTLVNDGRFETQGVALSGSGFGNPVTLNLVNNGTIKANLDGTSPAVSVDGVSFTNNGTVEATRGTGVALLSNAGSTLTNSGTISATGGAAVLFAGGNASSGTVVNKAGGIIRGDTTAIAVKPDDSIWSYSSTSITNAGTIIGNVDMRDAASTDRFIMQKGGTVVGDVFLGDGNDIFLIDVSGASGSLTGVSGVLDGGAGRDQLSTRVTEDAEITLGNYRNFEVVSLEVSKDRQAKLTGDTGGALLDIYGDGTADLALSISGQNATLIDASGSRLNGAGNRYVQTGTSIISRGAITASFDNTVYYGTAILLDQLDSFTNAGSIIFSQVANPYGGRATAIGGGLEVVNNGQIVLNGGSAIVSAESVVNSGTILQADGGASAVGISSVRNLTNSGTIRVSGGAVFSSDYSSTAISNSGTIQSTGAQAIRGGYAITTIVNDAGGTIAGGTGFEAIALAGGGAVNNAGIINGTVNLAYSLYGSSYVAGAYVDRGGTLNGDLLFGSGNDILVATSDTLGITGRIDAGAGIDTLIRSYAESRTVDLLATPSLPAGFELWGVGASGKDTVVTLAAAGSPIRQALTLVGDATIVNLADFTTTQSSQQVLTLGSSADPFNLSGAGSTLTFINRGTIQGMVGGSAASFENEGLIRNRFAGGIAVQLDASDEDSFVFKNSGTITSVDNSPYYYGATGVVIESSSDRLIADASIANSGTIQGGLSASVYATNFSFSNDGSIERGTPYYPSVSLSVGQAYSNGLDVNADRATIRNGGTLANGMSASIAAKTLDFSNSGTIGSPTGGFALSLMQTAHQTGDAEQGIYGEIDQESLSFTNSGTLNGNANIYSRATTIALTNSGTINAPVTGLLEGDDAALDFEASSLGNQTIVFANSGQISTDRVGAAAVAIESSARSVEQSMHGFDPEAAPIDGQPTSTIQITNSGTLSADGGGGYIPASPPPYPWYPSIPETLVPVAGLSVSASSGGLSSITVTNEVSGVISATGATRSMDDAESPVIAGLENLGSTAFLGIANQINLVNAGTIRGLAGGIIPEDFQIELVGSDADFSGKFLAGAILTINSTDRITNAATGVITGSVDLGAFDDRMANYGTINGNVYLGEGDDSFTHGIAAIQNGVVDGGTGTDALIIDISGGGLLDQATLDKFVSFESHALTGTGTITTDGPLSIDSLILSDANLTLAAGQTLQTASDISIVFADGVNSLTNYGTISGGLSFAGGTNSFVNRGSIAGPVTLGSGNNEFTIGAGSSVSGPVIAGGADDLLILAAGGNDQSPQELQLSGFTGFERTRQDGGTLALSGEYRTGQLTVATGRFIGRTGSILNAGSVLVNQGATFGSAGTVNGNVTVQGVLSPGSSPGTMTVNGNVALAGSSTTLFEMTPTISDALVINGTLTIAPGATLTLTGNRPLTPGVTYQLITASNGISGSFTTIDQASTVIGFIRQGRQSIDLLGQFVLGSGASRQVTQTVDYLNGLLIGGTATSGILSAAPSLLLADGTVNPATISRLNAESYASASQIGIENGLAIASALRTASNSAREDVAGLFTFGQTLGGWRRLPGDRTVGTSRADVSTYGALAGIGFGSQSASVGAFIGYIDARQQTGALQARTEADGILAGVVAQGAFSGFNVAASLSYDGSKADTNRTLLGSGKVSSHYRLRSWTADVSIGHVFGMADGWSLEPEIGFTHISSRRGGASETGDAVWALDVDARRTKASFLRGALELHGSAEARISPWLSAGVLHQLSGAKTVATASYIGVPDGLAITGAGRSETLATVGAGLNVRVSPGATLYLGANSEFGAQSSGQGATIGYRIRF